MTRKVVLRVGNNFKPIEVKRNWIYALFIVGLSNNLGEH